MKSVTLNVPDERANEFVERLAGLMKDCGATIKEQNSAKEYVPEKGEFVAFSDTDGESPFVGIFKVWYKDSNDKIVCYAHINGDGVLKHEEVYCNAYYIRSATDEEKEKLIKAMAKAGKRWNAEKQEVENCEVYEAIRTFDDACDDLKKRADEGDTLAKDLINDLQLNSPFTPDLLAYIKLRIIAYAINGGWKPKFTTDEYRYYPWFYLYTQKELDEMDEKERSRVVYRSYYYAYTYGGVAYVYAFDGASSSDFGIGSRLAFKDRARAEYAGCQFLELWADFNFIPKEPSAE